MNLRYSAEILKAFHFSIAINTVLLSGRLLATEPIVLSKGANPTVYIFADDGLENGRRLANSPGVDDLVALKLDTQGLPEDAVLSVDFGKPESEITVEVYGELPGPVLEAEDWYERLWPFGSQDPSTSFVDAKPLTFPLKRSALSNDTVYLRVVASDKADTFEGAPRIGAPWEELAKSLTQELSFAYGPGDGTTNTYATFSVPVRTVLGSGDPKFFEAAHSYIRRHDAPYYSGRRAYNFSKANLEGATESAVDLVRYIVFPTANARMEIYETYYRPDADGEIIWGIDKMIAHRPESEVIVNGAYFFTNEWEDFETTGRGEKELPHSKYIRGRLVHDGIKSPVSTQRKVDDHNPEKCEREEFYLAQDTDVAGSAITIREGKVPLIHSDKEAPIIIPPCNKSYRPDGAAMEPPAPDPDPAVRCEFDEALGGLHQMHGLDQASRMPSSMIGLADITLESGEKTQFIVLASTESGTGICGEDFVSEMKNSGVVREDGTDTIYQLDGGGSRALACTDAFGKLQSVVKAGRHTEPAQGNINHYILFDLGD